MKLINILTHTNTNALVRRLMAFVCFMSFLVSDISFLTILSAGLYFICLFMNEDF